jgi:ribonuclease HI
MEWLHHASYRRISQRLEGRGSLLFCHFTRSPAGLAAGPLGDHPMPQQPDATIHTDGACSGNPGPAGAGYVICDAAGATLAEGAVPIGQGTNNIAEYQGVISSLEKAHELGLRHVVVRSDSELMCKQMWGKYRVKNPVLMKMHVRVRELMREFDQVTFVHVPREHNEDADRLARQAVVQARQGLAAKGRAT